MCLTISECVPAVTKKSLGAISNRAAPLVDNVPPSVGSFTQIVLKKRMKANMGADLNLYDWAGKSLKVGLVANPNDGALLVSPSAAKYAARALQGKTWSVSMAGGGTSLGATNVIGSTTPLVGIYNPLGNKFRASIIRAVVWTLSGTPAGPLLWGYSRGVSLTGGTSVAVNNDTLSPGTADGIQTFVNSAAGGLTSTLLRAIGGLTSVAVGTGAASVVEETAGSIPVEPGNFIGIFATAAGTSHVAGASLEFETISV